VSSSGGGVVAQQQPPSQKKEEDTTDNDATMSEAALKRTFDETQEEHQQEGGHMMLLENINDPVLIISRLPDPIRHIVLNEQTNEKQVQVLVAILNEWYETLTYLEKVMVDSQQSELGKYEKLVEILTRKEAGKKAAEQG
jgi:hypothetical protein